MLGNNSLGVSWFKDAFVKGVFREDWQEVRKPYQNATGATLFFYPHGNLVLAKSADEGERKIDAKATDDLLEAIISKWNDGSSTPIFVCEGTVEQKKKSIERSSYLQRVSREVLTDQSESLVIFGWGIGDQDTHILDQVKRTSVKRIAVSVHDTALVEHARSTIEKAGLPKPVFFDANSPGCWNNIDE